MLEQYIKQKNVPVISKTMRNPLYRKQLKGRGMNSKLEKIQANSEPETSDLQRRNSGNYGFN